MSTNRPWKATNRAEQYEVEGRPSCLVMVVEDRAYQQAEWIPGTDLGHPDIMKGPDGMWIWSQDERATRVVLREL